MTINTNHLEELIKGQLSQNFPDFHSEIEPRIENKIEIKEKEVKVNSPLPPPQVQTVIPKVNPSYVSLSNCSVC
jgi:hypothetical protein